MAKSDAGKLPWLKFYPADWRADPALRMCSIAARGLWMEMLCLMHEADPAGSLLINGKPVTPRQLGALSALPVKEVEGLLAELEEAGVFSRDDDGTIFSRRMRRDVAKSEQAKAFGATGGNPKLKGAGKGRVNPPDMPDNDQDKAEVIPSIGSGNPGDNPVDKFHARERAPTTQRPEARGQNPNLAAAADSSVDAERDLVRRIRIAMGSEPVIATAEYPTGILRMLDAGQQDGSVVEADVFAGIAAMFERCEHGWRCRRYSQVENWIRGAAKDRLAGKPRSGTPRGGQAEPAGTTLIRGVPVPNDRIQARVDQFEATGAWPDDVRDRWGPAPGEFGSCIPSRFLKPKVDA